MRTVDRFAFIFGIVNLVLGALSMFSPLVSHKTTRNPITRIRQRRQRGIINRQPGWLLGFLPSVSPPHTMVHSALGAAGLATRRYSGMSRAYMLMSGLMFAAMAAIGWAKVGFKPGIQSVKGMSVDRWGNVLHTLWGVGALLLAMRPEMGMSPVEREINQAISEVSAY